MNDPRRCWKKTGRSSSHWKRSWVKVGGHSTRFQGEKWLNCQCSRYRSFFDRPVSYFGMIFFLISRPSTFANHLLETFLNIHFRTLLMWLDRPFWVVWYIQFNVRWQSISDLSKIDENDRFPTAKNQSETLNFLKLIFKRKETDSDLNTSEE